MRSNGVFWCRNETFLLYLVFEWFYWIHWCILLSWKRKHKVNNVIKTVYYGVVAQTLNKHKLAIYSLSLFFSGWLYSAKFQHEYSVDAHISSRFHAHLTRLPTPTFAMAQKTRRSKSMCFYPGFSSPLTNAYKSMLLFSSVFVCLVAKEYGISRVY